MIEGFNILRNIGQFDGGVAAESARARQAGGAGPSREMS